MKTVTINLPDNVEVDEKEIAVILAAKLYEMGVISMGKGAELAGLSYREFFESLGKYGVSIWDNYTSEDLERDVKNAQNYHR